MTDHSGRKNMLSRATLLQKLGGYVQTQLIYCFARLGVADLVQDGPQSGAALAAALMLDPARLDRLLRGWVNIGLLSETAPATYAATPAGQWLESARAGSLRDVALLTGDEWYPAWGGLLDGVTSGQTPFEAVFGADHYGYMQQHPASARRFNDFMQVRTEQSAQAVVESYDFSAAQTIVDVGGGNGTLLRAILSAHPHARGVLFDTPGVVADLGGPCADAAVAARCERVGGDFLRAVPAGGDCYLLSQVLHNWPDAACLQILRHCHAAMTADGRLLIIEPLLPVALTPPMPVVEMDLMMLVLLGGNSRTDAALRALLQQAGYLVTRSWGLRFAGFGLIEARKA